MGILLKSLTVYFPLALAKVEHSYETCKKISLFRIQETTIHPRGTTMFLP